MNEQFAILISSFIIIIIIRHQFKTPNHITNLLNMKKHRNTFSIYTLLLPTNTIEISGNPSQNIIHVYTNEKLETLYINLRPTHVCMSTSAETSYIVLTLSITGTTISYPIHLNAPHTCTLTDPSRSPVTRAPGISNINATHRLDNVSSVPRCFKSQTPRISPTRAPFSEPLHYSV